MEPTQSNRLSSEPGPNIIRAWFATIMNPLVDALKVEHSYLQSGNWSWNHFRGELETVQLTARHLGNNIEPNLHQFFRFNEDIRSVADDHDRYVVGLLERCGGLQRLLEEHEKFQRVCNEATAPAILKEMQAAGQDVAHFTGDHSRSDDVALFAEYVINSRGILPYYYTTSSVWNAWRERLLEIREVDGLYSYFDDLIAYGEELDQCVVNMTRVLIDRRDELSLRHDVPIIDLREAG